MKSIDSFYAGDWQQSLNKQSIIAPYDQQLLGEVSLISEDALGTIIGSAKKAFETYQWIDACDIASILQDLHDLIHKDKDRFAQCISKEAGKPIGLAQAEVQRGLATILDGIRCCGHDTGQTIPMDIAKGAGQKFAFQERFPMGIVVGITPFNFPLNLVLHKLVPALVSKNVFILKPALQTPMTSQLLMETLLKTNLPKNVVQCVFCENDVAESLSTHEDVQILTFTGSSSVGWRLKQQAVYQKVLLECGGVASLVVDDSADLDQAVNAVISGGFNYSGQTCISVQRVYIHQSIFEPFKHMLLQAIKAVKSGPPEDNTASLSCLINDDATRNVSQSINDACQQGASILFGGNFDGNYCSPTILVDVPISSDLWTKEIFGPVVSLSPYHHLSEVVSDINKSPYGLQHGFFSTNIHHIMFFYRHLRSGGVMINEGPMWRADHMPYGGVKKSGNTFEGIQYAVEEMTTPRLCVMHL